MYKRQLYLREPQDKPVLRTEDLSFLPASPETAEKFLRTMLSVPTAAALRTQIESRGDDVMFTLDTHNDDYPTTQEGKNLPVPHCIAGTPGHRLFGETAACRQKQDMVFFKPSFGSMEMLCYLRTHPYQEIELVGVVTNICVISNAVLCKAALPEARVSVDASLCASNDEALHEKALDVMRGLQINVTNFDK